MLIQEITDRRLLVLSDDKGTVEQNRIDIIRDIVEVLQLTQYLELIDTIYEKAFTPIAQTSKGKGEGEGESANNSQTTNCRFLKEAEQFITVKRAIRYEDVSYLRQVVDHLILPFLGAGQSNYSRLIIYLRLLLDDRIADRIL